MRWDPDSGYDYDDPKHPTWRERMADIADDVRKHARENGENPHYGPGNPDWERDRERERLRDEWRPDEAADEASARYEDSRRQREDER